MMKDAASAILFQAVLSFLATATERGDQRLSRSMGLRDDQAERLRAMTARKVMKMAALSGACIQVTIDAEAFEALEHAVDCDLEHEDLVEAFIRGGASRQMMAALFDMNPRSYARMRTKLGVTESRQGGRSRAVNEEQAEAIYSALEERGGQVEPVDLLDLAATLGLPLRVVWEEMAANPASSEIASLTDPSLIKNWPRTIN